MFVVNFQFKFKQSDDKLWEHTVYFGNEEATNESIEKIKNRYSMYLEFEIDKREIK